MNKGYNVLEAFMAHLSIGSGGHIKHPQTSLSFKVGNSSQ